MQFDTDPGYRSAEDDDDEEAIERQDADEERLTAPEQGAGTTLFKPPQTSSETDTTFPPPEKDQGEEPVRLAPEHTDREAGQPRLTPPSHKGPEQRLERQRAAEDAATPPDPDSHETAEVAEPQALHEPAPAAHNVGASAVKGAEVTTELDEPAAGESHEAAAASRPRQAQAPETQPDGDELEAAPQAQAAKNSSATAPLPSLKADGGRTEAEGVDFDEIPTIPDGSVHTILSHRGLFFEDAGGEGRERAAPPIPAGPADESQLNTETSNAAEADQGKTGIPPPQPIAGGSTGPDEPEKGREEADEPEPEAPSSSKQAEPSAPSAETPAPTGNPESPASQQRPELVIPPPTLDGVPNFYLQDPFRNAVNAAVERHDTVEPADIHRALTGIAQHNRPSYTQATSVDTGSTSITDIYPAGNVGEQQMLGKLHHEKIIPQDRPDIDRAVVEVVREVGAYPYVIGYIQVNLPGLYRQDGAATAQTPTGESAVRSYLHYAVERAQRQERRTLIEARDIAREATHRDRPAVDKEAANPTGPFRVLTKFHELRAQRRRSGKQT